MRRERHLDALEEGVQRTPLAVPLGVGVGVRGLLGVVRSGKGAGAHEGDVGRVGDRRRAVTLWCYHVVRGIRVIVRVAGDEHGVVRESDGGRAR